MHVLHALSSVNNSLYNSFNINVYYYLSGGPLSSTIDPDHDYDLSTGIIYENKYLRVILRSSQPELVHQFSMNH